VSFIVIFGTLSFPMWLMCPLPMRQMPGAGGSRFSSCLSVCAWVRPGGERNYRAGCCRLLSKISRRFESCQTIPLKNCNTMHGCWGDVNRLFALLNRLKELNRLPAKVCFIALCDSFLSLSFPIMYITHQWASSCIQSYNFVILKLVRNWI